MGFFHLAYNTEKKEYVMLLNDPSKGNVERLIADCQKTGWKLSKEMLPRGKTEMPNFTATAVARANMVRDTLRQKGRVSPDEIYAIVCDAWMESLRLIELATLDGKRVNEADIFMHDPPIGTNEPKELEALVIMRLFVDGLRTKKK